VTAERAPRHLKAATRRWWETVAGDYHLEAHHLRTLTAASEAWDRYQEARELLAREGAVYRDRFDSPRKHPAVSIEENARTAFLRAVRELALEDSDQPEVRPPRLRRVG